MSERKHTPGPWKRAERDDSLIIDFRTVHIARVVETGMGAQFETNARLIAAAPEMLAALREIVATVHPNTGGTQGAIRAFAATAIAKAEGRS